MFDSITITNFMRIHAPIKVPLGPVTIIVGENGSGKSSILKAIHWSIRCATLRDNNNKVTLERMDYTPSRDFLHLSHKTKLNSESTSPRVRVTLESQIGKTEIRLKSTRNDAGINVEVTGKQSNIFTTNTNTSSYIPGLAGLSEAESLLATPVLHRKAASGEGGSVLRHILLGLASSSTGNQSIQNHYELLELNKWVEKIFPGVRFWVKFDQLRDVYIDAKFLTKDLVEPKKLEQQWKSLDMAGTGFLQVVQIFAYLLHFKPKLLLIDEPDAHLHPSTQEKLINAIELAAKAFPETQFIITTHSPNLVRAATSTSKVVWVQDGALRAETDEQVRHRMGWGALDKDLMLITEDSNLVYMKNVINQWPEIARKTLIWPTFGASSLPRAAAIIKFQEELGIPVVIHRDRDFLSDHDIAALKNKMEYDIHKIPFWTPPNSDIEDTFCNPDHISKVLEITNTEALEIISDTLNKFDKNVVEQDFSAAYQGALGGIQKEKVGTPISRWSDLGGFCQRTIKGKVFLQKIKIHITDKYKSTEHKNKLGKLDELNIPTVIVHENLKELIEKSIENFKTTKKKIN